jgi:hypothetical protein
MGESDFDVPLEKHWQTDGKIEIIQMEIKEAEVIEKKRRAVNQPAGYIGVFATPVKTPIAVIWVCDYDRRNR